MFSKEASYAKSCKVVYMLAGTDHPAFMAALEGRHGPPQSPEQKLQTSASQAACLLLCVRLVWLQDNSTKAGVSVCSPCVMGAYPVT